MIWSMLLLPVLCARLACGGIILDSPETWGSGLAGWTNAAPIGTEDATLSNPGGYLGIRFNTQGGPPIFEDDIIYTTGTNYTGSYQTTNTQLYLRFSFYAEDVLSPLTEVYLHSAVSGNTWEYAFTNSSIGSWIQHDIAFSYSAGWIGPGSATDFWNDLANIDWIGVYVVRKLDTIQQDYGIDNWEYYEVIPEPGTISILVASLVSFGLVLRRRRSREA